MKKSRASRTKEALATIGHKRWVIAEGYIPASSHGPKPEMLSHETACILNSTNRDAHVKITVEWLRESIASAPKDNSAEDATPPTAEEPATGQ